MLVAINERHGLGARRRAKNELGILQICPSLYTRCPVFPERIFFTYEQFKKLFF